MAGTDPIMGTMYIPSAEPTVCAPESFVRTLTTNDNAISLGNLGFISGVIACVLFYVAVRYVGPWVYIQGADRGWWS